MKPYDIRRREDGRLELVPRGAQRALLVFDTTEELVTALSKLTPRMNAAVCDSNGNLRLGDPASVEPPLLADRQGVD